MKLIYIHVPAQKYKIYLYTVYSIEYICIIKIRQKSHSPSPDFFIFPTDECRLLSLPCPAQQHKQHSFFLFPETNQSYVVSELIVYI